MMKKLLPCMRGYGWMAVLGILCSAAEAVFELLIPMIMSDIVDIGIANGNTGFIMREGLKMAAMAMASLCFGVGGAALSSVTGMGFGANLRQAEYAHLQKFAFSNIEKFSTASLVTRLTNDVNALQMSLMMGMRLMVRSPVMLIAALFFSVRISARLSGVFLVSLPVLAVIIAAILVRASPMFRTLQENTDALNLVVQENLTGIRVVKSFVRENGEEEKFRLRNRTLRDTSLKAFGMVVMNMPLMMLVVYSTMIAVMWFGGNMVHEHTLETGDLMVYFTYIMQIMMSLMMVSMMFMILTRAVACARRIVEVLDETPAIVDTAQAVGQAAQVAGQETQAVGQAAQTAGQETQAVGQASKTVETVPDGSIDFENVSFRYHTENDEQVLTDITLHIRSGSVVGILGGTGSGKTTLVSLIPRLYETQSGTVYVGGKPVAEYPMHILRGAVSMVLQKNTLFSGTVRENLLWGNPSASEEELWTACRMACAEEFLRRMPDGLDTRLEQGGVNLSGGQRQRVCIARAVLTKPKILILDDSTSAVDMATDAKIRTAFRDSLPGTTKLIIAQRVASVMDADQIVVMDDGKIVDQGTHTELLVRCAIYQDVYRSQMEGVEEHG